MSQQNKRRLSRRSGSPSELSQATGGTPRASTLPSQPAKRIKEEPRSDREADLAQPPSYEVGESDDEDVVIPSADPDASETESHLDFDNDDADDSDGGIGALASRTKQAQGAGGAKWDADSKRARFNEKYGHLSPEETLGVFRLCFCSLASLIPLNQTQWRRGGAPLLMPTSSSRPSLWTRRAKFTIVLRARSKLYLLSHTMAYH